MIRLVATADNHLGRNYPRMSLAALETRRRFLRRAFGEVCRYAIEQRADLFILAGDLFDFPAPRNIDRLTVARYLAALRRAGVPVIAVDGNHDTPRSRSEDGGRTPLEVYQAAGLLTYFRELEGETPQVPFEVIPTASGQTLAIGGFSPNLAQGEGDDPFTAVAGGAPRADLRVLVTHCLVEGWIHPGATEPTARRASLEALRDIDLVVVGDLHDYQTGRWGGVHVVSPGATERMEFGSDGAEPGFAEAILGDDGQLTICHRKVDAQPRVALALGAPDLDPADPNASVVARVEAALDERGAETLVEVSLAGIVPLEVYQALSYAEVAERLRGKLCHLQWDAGGLRPPRAAGLPGSANLSRTLADDVRAAVATLAQESTGEDQALLPEVEQSLLAVIEGREVA